MKGLGSSFRIENEEWYTWDKDPRPNVHVLATVDENSYTPKPRFKWAAIIRWYGLTNTRRREIYIFMGHHPELFQNKSFTRSL